MIRFYYPSQLRNEICSIDGDSLKCYYDAGGSPASWKKMPYVSVNGGVIEIVDRFQTYALLWIESIHFLLKDTLPIAPWGCYFEQDGFLRDDTGVVFTTSTEVATLYRHSIPAGMVKYMLERG